MRKDVWLKLTIVDKITSPELNVLFLSVTFEVLTTVSVGSFTSKLLLEMMMSEAWLMTISSTFSTFFFLATVPLLCARSRRPPRVRAWKFEIVSFEFFPKVCTMCTMHMRALVVAPSTSGEDEIASQEIVSEHHHCYQNHHYHCPHNFQLHHHRDHHHCQLMQWKNSITED